jgi:hypothetical protein
VDLVLTVVRDAFYVILCRILSLSSTMDVDQHCAAQVLGVVRSWPLQPAQSLRPQC